MKPMNQFKLYAGGMGAVTLLAILASIHEQLITVGPWVLDSMLAAAASALIYGGVRVYVSGRKHWITMREQEQQYTHLKSRNELELLGMRTKIYIELTRLPADGNGNFPALLPPAFVSPAEMAGNVLVLPPGQIRQPGQRLLNGPKQPEPVQENTPLPVAPPFWQIESQITGERFLICYGSNGPVWGNIDDLLSSNIVGKPGRGKTTMLFFFTAQFLKTGAHVIAFDPHGSMIEIADYIEYEHEYNEMSRAVPRVLAMVDDRLRAYKQWQKDKGARPALLEQPVLFMVDELPAISSWEQEQRTAKHEFFSIIALIKRIILESRKTRMYVILSGQAISYKILPTDARDNLSSHFVFESTRNHATMAGLEAEEISNLLSRLKGRDVSLGRCVVSLARDSEAFIGAVPATGQDDLARIVDSLPVQDDEEMPPLRAMQKPDEQEPKIVQIFAKRQQYRKASYEEVVQAWNAGYNTKRTMAKYLDISEWQAQAWCRRLTEESQSLASEEYEEAN